MAITYTPTTGGVILDETFGLQSDTDTDGTDADVLLTGLPGNFTSRLTTLNLLPDLHASDVGGATGTLGTVENTEGAPITGITFNFTEGGDSGLTTLDGTMIVYEADAGAGADSNLVLLREAGSGDYVGAIYLTTSGIGTDTVTVTASLIQFEPFDHGDDTDPDDVEFLSGLSISASTVLDFGFDGAPSGQSYFLVLQDDDSSTQVLVAGKDPVNDTDVDNITEGDTVNTSKGGGDTTAGSNNQMLNPGDGLHFLFVRGQPSDLTVPNLDQNEADDQNNIQFNDLVDVPGASIFIVQTQPGGGPKGSATVQLSAFNSDDGVAANETGQNAGGTGGTFAEELDDNVKVNILTVKVIRDGIDISGAASISIDITNGIATVDGIRAGDEIAYTTVGTHNLVLIENPDDDQDSAKFDIGGISILESDGENFNINNLGFDDDGPSASTQTDTETLQTDDSDTPDDTSSDDFSGYFDLDGGEDGTKSTVYTLDVTDGDDSGFDDVLTGSNILLYQVNTTTVEGRVGGIAGAVALTFTVDGSGNVTMEQDRAVEHFNTSSDNESESMDTGVLDLTATITDNDDDTDSATIDLGALVSILDDGPSASTQTDTETLQTDDSDTPDDTSSDDFSGYFDLDGGEDGTKSTVYTLDVTDGDDSGFDDVLTGSNILLYQVNTTTVEGRVGGIAGAVALTFTVDGSGNVTMEQDRAVEHFNTSSDNEFESMDTGVLDLTATITDNDDDTDSATIDLGALVSILDDGPSASTQTDTETLQTDDSDTPDDTSSDDFSGYFDLDGGEDGTKSTVYTLDVTDGDDSGFDDVLTGSNILLYQVNTTTVEGRVGGIAGAVALTFTVDGSGNVTMEQDRAVEHFNTSSDNESESMDTGVLDLTATITDNDDDTDSATIDLGALVSILDDGPSASTQTDTETLQTDDSDTPDDTSSDDFSGYFDLDGGEDGTKSTVYTLDVTDGDDSGFDDVLTGSNILLYQVNTTTVEGRVGGIAGAVALTFTVDGSGNVTMEQDRAVEHFNTSSDNESESMDTGVLDLTATITDNDDDTDSATIDLGALVSILDDGPSASTQTDTETLQTDDSDTPDDTSSDDFSGYFDLDGGEDGTKSTVYTLDVTNGDDSGFDDVLTGSNILLYQVNTTTVVGRVGGPAGAIALTFTVDGSGNVTMEQDRAVEHFNTSSDNESESMDTGVLDLTATITDNDDDTDSATIDLGALVSILDDGPTLGSIPDSTNALVFEAGTDTGTFTFDAGADGGSVALTDYTDPDDAGDLASSGLGALETLLGVNITATQSGNTVTYFTPDGDDVGTDPDPLFQLTLTDGDWTFEIFQDAPIVDFDLNIGALAPGSPTEDETFTGQTGGGLDVVFDGLNWRGLVNTPDVGLFETASDSTPPPDANLGPGNTADDINTNQQGFGIKDGQASQVNNLEGFFAAFDDGAPGGEDEVFGFFFDIEGIGGITEVTINWLVFDDENDNGILDGGESFATGSELVALPGGNNDIQFKLSTTDDLSDPDDIVVGIEFDHVYIQAVTPDGLTMGELNDDDGSWNDGVRFNDFGTVERADIPDIVLTFDAQGTDGDDDETQEESFDIFISEDGGAIV